MSVRNSASKCRRRHLHGAIRALLLLLVPLATATDAVAQQTKPNVLLVLMDDVGIEHIGVFGVGQPGNFATTLNLDAFQLSSVRFQDAWSNPVCSPTRATIQTGRYGFRTGIGKTIPCDTAGQPGEDLDCCSEACGGAAHAPQCSIPGFPPEEPACQ